jgi:aryl-alcohol dehydrogenase-like predicted oxidoreductase
MNADARYNQMNTSTMIKMRSLGKTGIQVSPIGLGTLMFGTGGFPQNLVSPLVIPQEEKNAIVKAALDGGITWFDTYGHYEQSLVVALKKAGKSDGDVVIATKWEPFFKTAGSITRTIDEHINSLDRYRIGLYIVHFPVSLSSPEAEMNAMADLVESGKIRSVGVSNFSAKRMRRAFNALRARGIPLAVNQVLYNLVNRKIETNGVLETAKELGVTIMTHSPLMEGLLTGKYHKNPELIKRMGIIRRRMMIKPYLEKSRPLINALEEIAPKYSATPAQVALNWLIDFHGDSIVAIPGASNAHQAESNAAAMRLRLSEDDMARLDELSRDFR